MTIVATIVLSLGKFSSCKLRVYEIIFRTSCKVLPTNLEQYMGLDWPALSKMNCKKQTRIPLSNFPVSQKVAGGRIFHGNEVHTHKYLSIYLFLLHLQSRDQVLISQYIRPNILISAQSNCQNPWSCCLPGETNAAGLNKLQSNMGLSYSVGILTEIKTRLQIKFWW